ncbi:hypothetical protein GCM10008171_21650 [Methylopila jiangsuensis]|uniref:Uncharacterized protein n=1 Tax=Methylopila jiangsuensis TaxID=586230 RepID=A0A9W6JIA2_9HYPH|nr:DUF6476 family protein [Methylopila jiangsuensis]MDR6286743.1 hypothetical protein [Methylopila jiangsuensis]GLK76911.1 hypothetical protein GCM10008171_21650 [Methylopila jiangsuensis]
MTALGGPNGPVADEVADDDDPRIAQVYQRLRRLFLIGGLTMGVGFLAVMSAIVYRVVKSKQAEAGAAHAAIALPEGARVVATAADSGRLIVTVEQDGRTSLRLFDAATLKELGRLDLAPGAPAAAPLR